MSMRCVVPYLQPVSRTRLSPARKRLNKGKIDPMRYLKHVSLILFIAGILTACHAPVTGEIMAPIQPTLVWNSLPSPVPSPTSQPPTPTAEPVTEPVIATVWQQAPQAPVLMYHRFDPLPGASSYSFTTSLTDFEGHLAALYDAGYSLVPLEDWLRGEIHVPPGRRPLIITLDDLFYGDQLALDKNGQPALYSGIGRLWKFHQELPDFGFSAALFFNFGDKAYANDYTNGVLSVQDGWRQNRAEAIAWGIRHGATPMNHFYSHPFLDTLTPTEIQWELAENDRALREALSLVGEEDLSKNLPNILALPYVVWPATDAGKQVLWDYRSPEGAPVSAIVEGDYATNARLFPAAFAEDYDPWHVPRINASWDAIRLITELAIDLPQAQTCDLGSLPLTAHQDPGLLAEAISEKINLQACPEGYYIIGQLTFEARSNSILQLSP